MLACCNILDGVESGVAHNVISASDHPGDYFPAVPRIGNGEVQKRVARDGSKKYVFPLADGLKLEAAFFKVPGRVRPNIACVSTQLGCAAGCVFCSTATAPFFRNLTAEEILWQIRTLADDNDLPSILNEGFEVSFMGMGEPLANLPNLLTAIDGIARNYPEVTRVSVSTAGPASRIDKLVQAMPASIPIHLQVSLHATDDSLRRRLIPRAPDSIARILDAAKSYHLKTGDHVCLNYIPLHGVNTSPDDALWLSRLNSEYFYVKLSALNRTNSLPLSLEPLSPEATRAFAEAIALSGVKVQIFEGDGLDVQASCGQLAATPRLVNMIPESREPDPWPILQ